MRQKLITLDAETWRLASEKSNFSEWVRNQLRSERNKRQKVWKYCNLCDTSMQTTQDYCMNSKCSGYFMERLEVLE
tara:strand:- start:618 stop:845 length:228 start_codon:yes stop_codon:yes gene_type:complete